MALWPVINGERAGGMERGRERKGCLLPNRSRDACSKQLHILTTRREKRRTTTDDDDVIYFRNHADRILEPGPALEPRA